ncbi:MAG: SurA N-terminal domain-containing protein [Desulfonatronovibrio sp.]
MLDVLRQNASSWIVKVLFAVIVVVFVFWGVGSFTNEQEGVLATVDDKPIMINDYVRAYENTVQSLRRQNPDITSEDLRNMQIKQQIFNQLLDSRLLLQKAGEMGITIPAGELQKEITSIPAFLNEEDKFDPGLYQGVLRANQLTPAEFEKDFQQDLLMRKMEEYLSLPAMPSEQEVADFYNYFQSQVKVDYLMTSWEDFADEISPSEEEILNYYEENKSSFMVPEKIKISYIKLTPRALAPLQDVSSEEIEQYYQANESDFVQEERLSARHILISVDENASEEEAEQARQKITEIKAQLDKGKDFAELAREYSQGPSADQGGDLGTFGRGQMVPEFEEAAFAMEPGEISDPVRTQFGWHLIKIEEHIPARTKGLDEVRARIRMEVGEEKAMDQLADIMDDVIEVIITGGDLNTAAERLDLEIRETDFFSRENGPEDLSLPETALNKLFNMAVTEITETPIMIENGYIFAQKTDAREETVKDVEEVRGEIQEAIIRAQAMDMAREEAEEHLDRVLASTETPEDIEAMLETSRSFGRQGSIPDLGMSSDLAASAFAADQGAWLDEVYRIDNGFVVARVAEHIRPSEDEFEQEKNQWMESYADMQKQQAFQSFVHMLRNEAKIRVIRPDIIEN